MSNLDITMILVGIIPTIWFTVRAIKKYHKEDNSFMVACCCVNLLFAPFLSYFVGGVIILGLTLYLPLAPFHLTHKYLFNNKSKEDNGS